MTLKSAKNNRFSLFMLYGFNSFTNDYFLKRNNSTNEVRAFERVASSCEKITEFKKTLKSSVINLIFASKFLNHILAWHSNTK